MKSAKNQSIKLISGLKQPFESVLFWHCYALGIVLILGTKIIYCVYFPLGLRCSGVLQANIKTMNTAEMQRSHSGEGGFEIRLRRNKRQAPSKDVPGRYTPEYSLIVFQDNVPKDLASVGHIGFYDPGDKLFQIYVEHFIYWSLKGAVPSNDKIKTVWGPALEILKENILLENKTKSIFADLAVADYLTHHRTLGYASAEHGYYHGFVQDPNPQHRYYRSVQHSHAEAAINGRNAVRDLIGNGDISNSYENILVTFLRTPTINPPLPDRDKSNVGSNWRKMYDKILDTIAPDFNSPRLYYFVIHRDRRSESVTVSAKSNELKNAFIRINNISAKYLSSEPTIYLPASFKTKTSGNAAEEKPVDLVKTEEYLSVVHRIEGDDVYIGAFHRTEENEKRKKYTLSKYELSKKVGREVQEGDSLNLTIQFKDNLPFAFEAKLIANKKDIELLDSRMKINANFSELFNYDD